MTSTDLPGIYNKQLKSSAIAWTGYPVVVVSLGCEEHSVLGNAAIHALQQADQIYGSTHHFSEIEKLELSGQKIPFPSPFSDLRDLLDQNKGKRIVVLASGDALYYGVGTWLYRLIGREHLQFHPNISSIQYCFHAIGMPWQQAEVVSLHGRPLSTLRRHIKNNQLLAIFTDSLTNPKVIATELCSQGHSDSTIWVCEAMGSRAQSVSEHCARDLANSQNQFHDLNICIVQLLRQDNNSQPALPSFPGIPDHLFSTGSEPGYGMISKREVRLSILSLMQPENGEIAWDIGAGCGSVSVEWARWNSSGQIYAIEQSEQRIEHLIQNNERFGTKLNLTPIQGTAPECCDALPDPDSIFIGGSGGLGPVLHYAWRRLNPGGKLVASAVSEDSINALQEFLQDKSGREWISLQVEKNLPEKPGNRKLAKVVIGKCIK